jgi:hypothetical protein
MNVAIEAVHILNVLTINCVRNNSQSDLEPSMSEDDLKSALKREPFVPMRLHLSNGLTYDVRHPENATVSKRMAAVVSGETIHLVSLVHINAVEPLSAMPM